ncbi:MAG TPA: hypothetical protein DD727_09585 [Clostridiales bacterium]|nr:hypothetical protein [Clostridiales bacterium]
MLDDFITTCKNVNGENYLILTRKPDRAGGAGYLGYQTRMVKRNPQPCLIPFDAGSMDGNIEIYYCITGLESLKSSLEKGKAEAAWGEYLARNVIKAFLCCKSLLLGESGLILTEDLIFLDFDRMEEGMPGIRFLYAPFEIQTDPWPGVRDFFQKLLIRLDPGEAHETQGSMFREFINRLNAGSPRAADLLALLEGRDVSAVGAVHLPDRKTDPGAGSRTDDDWSKQPDPFQEQTLPEQKNPGFLDLIGSGHWRAMHYAILAFGEFLLAGLVIWLWRSLPKGFGRAGVCLAAAAVGTLILSVILSLIDETEENPLKPAHDPAETICASMPAPRIEKYEPAHDLASPETKPQGLPADNGDETVLLYEGPRHRAWLEEETTDRGNASARCLILGDTFSIGREINGAGLKLTFRTVGRTHGEIRRREGKYYLVDLNSRNGTTVNDVLLDSGREYMLRPDDRICFGSVRYIFRESGKAASNSPAGGNSPQSGRE